MNLLAEPTRRQVYDAVRAGRVPMTRDAVAAASGISRRLATFHLDLLAEAGLLAVDYARPPGRSGPGAGRPAKRYLATDVDLDVSMPGRRYDVAARILARAVDVSSRSAADPRSAALVAARQEGERIGSERRVSRRRLTGRAALESADVALSDLGYEPIADDRGKRLVLRNCPFHAVVDVAPELVCTVNGEFLGGVLDGLGCDRLELCPDGVAPDCCVTVRR
ncbi:MAG: helix-turn-helix domain-containing protein [Frankiales bacterium]|nr:helix-turn-helix domain-containing protein [Frankiales bacterium]